MREDEGRKKRRGRRKVGRGREGERRRGREGEEKVRK